MRPVSRAAAVVLPLLLLTVPPARAALNEYFISTADLAASPSGAKIVDVRPAPLYLTGHIEGAIHLDKASFLDTRNDVPSLVPTEAQLERLLDSLGISRDDTVVAYADHTNPYAARLVWTLRYHGHAKSYVLDGGYDKWVKEGRATRVLPSFALRTQGYRVNAGRALRAEGKDVYAKLGNPAVVVWDTRSAEEYVGTDVRANRGGHIPTAVHLNWVDLQKEVDGVRVLKSEEEIRALLAAHGLTPDREVIAHCQTGIRSSYATLVLLGLGYARIKNYDGSWIEWANEPSFPVQSGATRGEIPRS